MPNPWPPVRLERVLKPILRPQSLDPMKECRCLGVRLDGGGPFLRETKLGSEIASRTLFQVKAGDFIYSRLFAWRGAFGVVPAEFDSCYVSGEFPTFQPIGGCIDVEFLRLWFCLPATLTRVEADCTGSTPLTRNRFKEEFFSALEIPLPPLDEQRRIVARTEQLAAKIQEAKRVRSRAEDESGSILDAAERSILGEPEHCQSPVKPLEAVCSVFIDCDHRTPAYKEEGVTLLRPRDIKRGHIDFSATVRIDPADHERRCVRHRPGLGDIVYSRELSFGNAGIISRQIDVSLGQGTLLVHADARLMLDHFLLRLLNAPAVRQQAESTAKGAAHPHVNLQDIRRFLVPVPPLAEEHRIVAYLDGLQAKVDALKKLQAETSAELDALLPSILDKAFRGEL